MTGLSLAVFPLSIGLISVALLWGILYDRGRYTQVIALSMFGKLSLLILNLKFNIFPDYDVLDYLPTFLLFVERQSLVTFFGIHVRAYTVLYPGWFMEVFGETESALFLIRISNIIISTILLYPLNELNKINFGKRLNRFQGLILLLFPSYLPFAIYVGRTQISVFLVLMSILAMFKILEKTTPQRIVGMLFIAFLTTVIRIHYIFYFIIPLILILGYNSLRQFGRQQGVIFLATSGGSVGAVSFVIYQKLANIYFGQSLSVARIVDLARNTSHGGSSYLTNIYPSTVSDFIWYLPLQGFYFLFSPFPWQLFDSDVSLLLIATTFEQTCLTVVVFIAIFYKIGYIKRNPTLLVLFGTILLTGMGMGMGVKNAGGAHRWRMPSQMLLVMISTSLLMRTGRLNDGNSQPGIRETNDES